MLAFNLAGFAFAAIDGAAGAMTDVTGFHRRGHLSEVCCAGAGGRRSGAGAGYPETPPGVMMERWRRRAGRHLAQIPVPGWGHPMGEMPHFLEWRDLRVRSGRSPAHLLLAVTPEAEAEVCQAAAAGVRHWLAAIGGSWCDGPAAGDHP